VRRPWSVLGVATGAFCDVTHRDKAASGPSISAIDAVLTLMEDKSASIQAAAAAAAADNAACPFRLAARLSSSLHLPFCAAYRCRRR